jgi:peptide/nickel transport system substrate-binding protein
MKTIKIDRKQLIALSMLLMLTTIFQINPVKAQELPVPREESVIMEIFSSISFSPSYNPLVPSGSDWGGAYHTIGIEYDWYYDYVTDTVIYWRITGWEYSDNYTTFTMYIRRGVTWNDGEPFTSQDVAFTLNTIKANPLLDGNLYANEWIESVETPDDYTVVIHLNKPNSRFQHTFRMWGNMPSEVAWHIWKDVNVTTFANYPPVETGPFKLYNIYTDLKMIVWVRDDNYWGKTVFGKSPAPKYVIVRQVPPTDVDLQDLVKGDLDVPIAWGITWDWANMASTLTENIAISEWLDPASGGITAMNVGRYPLNITEFRWAIAYSIDYETICQLGTAGPKAEPADFTWQRGWATKYRYQDLVEKYEHVYNTTRAEEILDDLGFVDQNADGWRENPDGSSLSIEVCTEPGIGWPDVGNELVLCLQDIGINAVLRVFTRDEFSDAREFGRFDIITGGMSSGIEYTNDLIYLLDAFTSKWYAPEGQRSVQGLMRAAPRYINPELDAIVDELWNLTDSDPKAAVLYKEGLEILMRDCIYIPLFQGPTAAVFSTKYWTNWPTTENAYNVAASWWPSFTFVLFEIEPVQASIEYASVWFTGNVTAFTGVDGKTYGPFEEGENGFLPIQDIEQLISENLASYSLPGLTEITNAIAQIQDQMSTQNTALTNSVNNLTAQISTIETMATVEGIGIIVLAIALVLALRKK